MKVRKLKKLRSTKQRFLVGKASWFRFKPPLRRDKNGKPELYVLIIEPDYNKMVFDELSSRREYAEDGNLPLMTGEIGSIVSMSIVANRLIGFGDEMVHQMSLPESGPGRKFEQPGTKGFAV